MAASAASLEGTPFAALVRAAERNELVRFALALALALTVFGVVLALQGSSPVDAYRGIWDTTLASKYGLSEVLVRAIRSCSSRSTRPAAWTCRRPTPRGRC